MSDYCAFICNHQCIKWMDYESTRQKLEEADALCHGNGIEIQRLRNYKMCIRDSIVYGQAALF